jgi:hypothetical protein
MSATALWTYFGIWLARVKKIYALTTNGMKILEQMFRSLPCNGMNEPNGRSIFFPNPGI